MTDGDDASNDTGERRATVIELVPAAWPRTAAPAPTDLLGLLTSIESLVDLVCTQDPAAAPGTLAAEASARTVALLDRLHAQRLGWLGRVEAEGAWRADTFRSFAHWVAWKERRGLPVARREVLAAARLRDDLPATLRAARAGRLSAPQVDVLARTLPTSDSRRDALATLHAQVGGTVDVTDPGPGEDRGSDAGEGCDVGTHSDAGATDDAGAADVPAAGETASDRLTSLEDRLHAPGCTADTGLCSCPRQVVTGEQVMLGLAERFDLRDLGSAARRFAHVADPESDERGYRLAQDREHLDLSRTTGGYHVAGFLTEEHGQELSTALAAIVGVPSAHDGLRPTQRRAIALAGLARRLLDDGGLGTGASVRPHVTVLVPWKDFEALAQRTGPHGGTGFGSRSAMSRRTTSVPPSAEDVRSELCSPGPTWLDGTGPVPRQVLERIAADCTVTRVVFGPDSEVLDVGRAQRTFTGARRKAVIARDRTWAWTGCDAPPQISEVHHARVHWADGGPTATDNAALLCWFHHQHVDRRRVAMTWRGGWHFDEPGSYDAPTAAPEPRARTR
ncbi:HNH endonuclease signature motif containing protein [Sanguibacter sp. HDW7]|uniref:HNH endonuclease signature motif containing protein n=1 Tax=Sanguibacter sp. HDW7 TaxID=2714931 RepID=UPI001409EB5B|nr:HNH endonuclease signature motif containing protein [Sanguibacter sp. HDW7]QIK82964.1 DUF222 domain-containing protein [Sanguibacter sp. HDW7]